MKSHMHHCQAKIKFPSSHGVVLYVTSRSYVFSVTMTRGWHHTHLNTETCISFEIDLRYDYEEINEGTNGEGGAWASVINRQFGRTFKAKWVTRRIRNFFRLIFYSFLIADMSQHYFCIMAIIPWLHMFTFIFLVSIRHSQHRTRTPPSNVVVLPRTNATLRFFKRWWNFHCTEPIFGHWWPFAFWLWHALAVFDHFLSSFAEYRKYPPHYCERNHVPIHFQCFTHSREPSMSSIYSCL